MEMRYSNLSIIAYRATLNIFCLSLFDLIMTLGKRGTERRQQKSFNMLLRKFYHNFLSLYAKQVGY